MVGIAVGRAVGISVGWEVGIGDGGRNIVGVGVGKGVGSIVGCGDGLALLGVLEVTFEINLNINSTTKKSLICRNEKKSGGVMFPVFVSC